MYFKCAVELLAYHEFVVLFYAYKRNYDSFGYAGMSIV